MENTNEKKLFSARINDTGGAASARKLLERPPESVYIEQWTELVVKEKGESKASTEKSLVIFRLGLEWFALPTIVFFDVAPVRVIHKIPHRSDQVIRGLVNLKGRLVLCVDLYHLLEIAPVSESNANSQQEKIKRMLSIQSEEGEWIFIVDELYGIYHTLGEQMENVPVTIAKSKANYLRGMLLWDRHSVGLIDEELLFYSLAKKTL